MAFQYHYQTGHPERQRFMCLSESYHGETIGALSVGGMDMYAKIYQPMMMHNIHFDGLDCFRCPYHKTRDTCSCECFESAEAAFEKFGKETAAVIVEPILQGAAGMRIYPAEYLRKLRKLCDEYGVLMIDDEIAAGFGRTGKLFAIEHAGISPDILCTSKGLTGAISPCPSPSPRNRSTTPSMTITASTRPSFTAIPMRATPSDALRRWRCSAS